MQGDEYFPPIVRVDDPHLVGGSQSPLRPQTAPGKDETDAPPGNGHGDAAGDHYRFSGSDWDLLPAACVEVRPRGAGRAVGGELCVRTHFFALHMDPNLSFRGLWRPQWTYIYDSMAPGPCQMGGFSHK